MAARVDARAPATNTMIKVTVTSRTAVPKLGLTVTGVLLATHCCVTTSTDDATRRSRSVCPARSGQAGSVVYCWSTSTASCRLRKLKITTLKASRTVRVSMTAYSSMRSAVMSHGVRPASSGRGKSAMPSPSTTIDVVGGASPFSALRAAGARELSPPPPPP